MAGKEEEAKVNRFSTLRFEVKPSVIGAVCKDRERSFVCAVQVMPCQKFTVYNFSHMLVA